MNTNLHVVKHALFLKGLSTTLLFLTLITLSWAQETSPPKIKTLVPRQAAWTLSYAAGNETESSKPRPKDLKVATFVVYEKLGQLTEIFVDGSKRITTVAPTPTGKGNYAVVEDVGSREPRVAALGEIPDSGSAQQGPVEVDSAQMLDFSEAFDTFGNFVRNYPGTEWVEPAHFQGVKAFNGVQAAHFQSPDGAQCWFDPQSGLPVAFRIGPRSLLYRHDASPTTRPTLSAAAKAAVDAFANRSRLAPGLK